MSRLEKELLRQITALRERVLPLQKRLDALDDRLMAEQERLALRRFPLGSRVRIVGCLCSSAADHIGHWIVDRYNREARDFRLRRDTDGGGVDATYSRPISLKRA